MSSPLWTGSATFGWRLDGLIGSRGWPTTNSATFSYDGLKRPTSMTETASGSSQAVFGQTYDRVGNVTSESRSLSGITGAAGAGSQDFTYDDLRRVTSATLAGATTSYTYDPSGDRTSVTRAGLTTAYTYDRADQLVTKQVGTDPATSFAYDTYGNLTTSQVATSGATGYTYDAADRLLSIDPVGTSDTVGFTLDALGRNRTRSVDGALADTYAYLGESESVTVLDRTVDVDAALSADGSRLAIKSGATLGWTLPDLHGSLAAVVSGTGGSVTDALRYDAYGETAASTTSALPTSWRYQGNLLLSEPGTSELYENGRPRLRPGSGRLHPARPGGGLGAGAHEPQPLPVRLGQPHDADRSVGPLPGLLRVARRRLPGRLRGRDDSPERGIRPPPSGRYDGLPSVPGGRSRLDPGTRKRDHVPEWRGAPDGGAPRPGA